MEQRKHYNINVESTIVNITKEEGLKYYRNSNKFIIDLGWSFVLFVEIKENMINLMSDVGTKSVKDVRNLRTEILRTKQKILSKYVK